MLGGLAIKLFNKDQVSAFRIVPHTSEISATGLICTSSRHRHAALPLDKEYLLNFMSLWNRVVKIDQCRRPKGMCC
jgi:hypothetical protein